MKATLNQLYEEFGDGHISVKYVYNQKSVILAEKDRVSFSRIMYCPLWILRRDLPPGTIISIECSKDNYNLYATVAIKRKVLKKIGKDEKLKRG
jgi:hypothetical protein